jgi:Flp pilus assembly protein TadD
VTFSTPGTAVRTAQTAVANRPRDPIAYVALGDAYGADRQYSLAFAEYDTAISLDPRNPRAYEQAGALAVNIGDLVRAEKYYLLGRASSPNDIGLLMAQGDLFLKLKRYSEARANYQRVQRLAPAEPDPVWRLGDVDGAQGRRVEALSEYGQAVLTLIKSIFR